MKILITGSTGLLGQALVKRLAPSCDVVGLSRHPPSCHGREQHVVCDVTDAHATQHVVKEVNPDVVIHTQALSNVDQCELNPQQATLQNVQAVEHLCHTLKGSEVPLLALSTDYVFDGAKGNPYDEFDEPNPVNVYGRTKLAGERIVLASSCGYVIRPSTLFGPGRRNFCDAIVQRAHRNELVQAFVDQRTSPTYTEDLAEGIGELIHVMARRMSRALPRIFHMANAGGCRRVEFAKRVLELIGAPDALLKPIRMEEQARPASRPAYSVLTSRHVYEVLGHILRPWDEALIAYLARLGWLN